MSSVERFTAGQKLAAASQGLLLECTAEAPEGGNGGRAWGRCNGMHRGGGGVEAKGIRGARGQGGPEESHGWGQDGA